MGFLYFMLGALVALIFHSILVIDSDTYERENRQLRKELEKKEKKIQQLETEKAILAHKVRQLENRYFIEKYRSV